MNRRERGWTIAGLVVAVVLLIGSVAWAVGTGGGGVRSPHWPDRYGRPDRGTSAQQDLPGAVVGVVVGDMGGRMRGMGDRMPGRMFLSTDRLDVPAGRVSLRVTNAGTVDHEVVVLPLGADQRIGQRTVRADGTVDESGSLGEASAGGAAGAGEGIEPGATGWVTLDLKPGRYELVCNLPGHYAAGMYGLLVVT